MPTDASSGDVSSGHDPSDRSSSNDAPSNDAASDALSDGLGLIHFKGSWTHEEVARLERAARAAETAGLPALPQNLGRPWIAFKYVAPSVTLCTASRPYVGTLTASDVAALAAQIEALARGNGC